MAAAWRTPGELFSPPSGRAEPAYREAFGRGFWDDLDAHPDIAASFDALMGPAGHGLPDSQVLVDPADWDSVRTVVDVGGGTGALLAEVLRARPGSAAFSSTSREQSLGRVKSSRPLAWRIV